MNTDDLKNETENGPSPVLGVVFIDEYGWVVTQEKSKHKVTLNGSYSWSCWANAWWHEIEKIEPKLPLSRLLCETLLVASL